MDRQAVFLAALRVRHPDERAARLDQLCGANAALRREVEDLLQAHDRERAERAAPPAPVHNGPRPSSRPSRGRVAVAQGALPRFSDETTALLRKRLMILALVMGLIRTVGLLTILSYPGLWLRLLVAGVYVGTFLLTWSSRPLSYRQLRWLELACLGGFTIQAVYMPSHLILARGACACAGQWTAARAAQWRQAQRAARGARQRWPAGRGFLALAHGTVAVPSTGADGARRCAGAHRFVALASLLTRHGLPVAANERQIDLAAPQAAS